MTRQVEDRKAPGLSLLIARHGKIAYRDFIGLLRPGGPPMREDAIFRIYSMTKPIVSVAAMMLVEEGRLLLSDPVAKYSARFRGDEGRVRARRRDRSKASGAANHPSRPDAAHVRPDLRISWSHPHPPDDPRGSYPQPPSIDGRAYLDPRRVAFARGVPGLPGNTATRPTSSGGSSKSWWSAASVNCLRSGFSRRSAWRTPPFIRRRPRSIGGPSRFRWTRPTPPMSTPSMRQLRRAMNSPAPASFRPSATTPVSRRCYTAAARSGGFESSARASSTR